MDDSPVIIDRDLYQDKSHILSGFDSSDLEHIDSAVEIAALRELLQALAAPIKEACSKCHIPDYCGDFCPYHWAKQIIKGER